MSERFSFDELKILAFDLGIKFQDLPHATAPEFIVALLEQVSFEEKLIQLLLGMQGKRPSPTMEPILLRLLRADFLEVQYRLLAVARNSGNKYSEVEALFKISESYYDQAQLAEAIEYLTYCIQIQTQLSHPNLGDTQVLLVKWQNELKNK
jgi:hypothetical protein